MNTAWKYLSSAGISTLGNSVAMVVWPWLVLQRTGDPAAAGMVAAAIAIPALLFAIIGGEVIDRFGRKRISVLSDVISGASVVALIIVDTSVGLHLGWFILLGIVGAIGDVPGLSARSALAGDVAYTSGKTLDFISGIHQTLMGVSLFIGPVFAGVLLAKLPIGQVLWVTAGCSFLAAILTALLRLQSDPNAPASIEATGITAWRMIVATPQMQLFAAAVFVSAMLVAPYMMVLLPAHFQSVNNPTMLGIVTAGYAVGMAIGGAAIAAIGSENRRLVWIASMGCFSLGFVGFAALEQQWIVLAGMVIAGVGSGVLGPMQMNIITESVAENLRGRAFSFFGALAQIASPLAFVLVTIILTKTTIYTTAVFIAILWIVCCVFFVYKGMRVFAVKG